MARIPAYDDPGYAKRYDKRSATTRAETRILRRMLADVAAGTEILDLPCGNGRMHPVLREFGPARVIGADGAFEMARQTFGEYDLTLVTDATRIPLPDDSVDVTFCFRLLHHVFESDARIGLLRELARVSRAYVLVSYYSRATLQGFRRRIRRKRPSGRTGISPAALRLELSAAGLRIVTSRSLMPLVREQTLVLCRKEPNSFMPGSSGVRKIAGG